MPAVAPDARLLTIVPMEQLYVVANYKETQLDRLHYGQPVEVAQHITRNNGLVQERLHLMAQQMQAGGAGAGDAASMALAQLANLVRREAFVMAYSDCFYIMGVAMLISVVAVFAMKKPAQHGAAAAE